MSFIIKLIKIEAPDIPSQLMPVFVSFYWGGILIGRITGPFLLKSISANKLLQYVALMSLFLVLTGIYGKGEVSIAAITLCGLSNSVMFPLIYSLAMQGLSPVVATQASGMISSTIAGGAIIPLFADIVADSVGIQQSFWISLFCYCVILFYSFYCHA